MESEEQWTDGRASAGLIAPGLKLGNETDIP